MRFQQHLALAVACATVGLVPLQAHAVTTHDTMANINQLVGATTFYSHGFTGTSAIVANVEAGYVWNQHLFEQQNTVFFSDPSITGQFDMHATAVGSVINANYGPNPSFNGIAPGATLWSGAIATSWDSVGAGVYSGNFEINNVSFSTPYYEALVSGVPQANGQTADVINSSWEDDVAPDGDSALALITDALLSASGKTLVFAAGNDGPGPNTVDSPSSGTNAFVVGGLQNDPVTGAYSSIASFSARGPSDFFVPADAAGDDGATFVRTRARIDITAPATDMALAYYGGPTGGNAFGGGMANPPNNFVAYPFSGTSFAAPIVASGAALVVDAGKTLFANDPHAIDGRIIKAVLMNSADKPVGWNNGQQLKSGVITTKQSLDYTYGAGILDLNQGWTQYTAGTTDLLDGTGHPTLTGGNVQSTGWTFGQITHLAGQTATVDYTISTPLTAAANLTTTLVWYSNDSATPDPDYDVNGLDATYGSFDNLDLSVFQLINGGLPQLIATSNSRFNSAEELAFSLPADGQYMIEVEENNYVYNFNGDTTTPFGLAWSVSVPEPTTAAIFLITGASLLARRRRIIL